MMSSLVYDVTEEEFTRAVVDRSNQVPVMVDFWAAWCGPCRTLSPILERVTEEAEGAIELAKVDVDANPRLSATFGVQGIPTVVAFKDGQPVSRFTGAIPEPAVRRFVDSLVPSPADAAVATVLKQIAADPTGAETALRRLISEFPDHPAAVAALARILIDRGERAESLDLLARLSPTPEVRRLTAEARLLAESDDDLASLEKRMEASPEDDGTRLELARGFARAQRYDDALATLLQIIADGSPQREDARETMLDIFEVLGTDHPQTTEYRRRLASALF